MPVSGCSESLFLQGSSSPSEDLRELIRAHQWDECLQELEEFPDLARERTVMYLHGEKLFVPYLHLAVYECAPERVVETLICCYPQALDLSDSKCGRFPLHFASMVRNNKAVRYLAATRPDILLVADHRQQLPLHYAVQYADTNTIEFLLEQCPQAASCRTSRARTPLHILASLRADTESNLPIQVFQKLVDCFPEALEIPELQGKLPLHLVAGQPFPRWDILQFISDRYPAALLLKTHDGLTPVDCARTFRDTQEDVVFGLLSEKTHAYRRSTGQFSFRLQLFKRKKADTFQHAYG